MTRHHCELNLLSQLLLYRTPAFVCVQVNGYNAYNGGDLLCVRALSNTCFVCVRACVRACVCVRALSNTRFYVRAGQASGVDLPCLPGHLQLQLHLLPACLQQTAAHRAAAFRSLSHGLRVGE
jgi:hypothetical protein